MSEMHHLAEEIARLRAENAELQAVLFTIRCQQLDQATDKTLSAQKHRKLAMTTRDWIIAALANEQEGK